MVAAVTAAGQKVAVKKIPDIFDDVDRAMRCLREVRILGHFARHRHIVSLVDLVEPVSLDTFNDIYIVHEYMETDLYKVLSQSHQRR